MTRHLLLSLFVVAACLVDAPSAQVISRNNPYRSFNVSGVNYASMQWELKHSRNSGKSWSGGHSTRRLFRGR